MTANLLSVIHEHNLLAHNIFSRYILKNEQLFYNNQQRQTDIQQQQQISNSEINIVNQLSILIKLLTKCIIKLLQIS